MNGMTTISELKEAIENGQKETVVSLLTQYDKTDLLGTDTLHTICRNGWLDIVKHLIEQKHLDLEEKDSVHGATPLHFACTSGNTGLVKYLINVCLCDHLIVSDDHFTTLHCAVMGGLDTAMYLMESPDGDILCQRTHTLMRYMYYIWSNNDNDNRLVKYLLAKKHYSITINEDTGDTLLHYACRESNIKQLKFLIQDCNCDPHVTNYNGDTLLHTYCSTLSSRKANMDMLFFICEKCTNDPLMRNRDYITPLDFIIMLKGEHMLTFSHLIKACKFNNNDRIHTISTAYNYWNHLIIKHLVVDNGCGFITNIENDNTLLHQACQDSHFDRLRFLIEECAGDPHIINTDGNTLLHAVCKSSSIDINIINYLCVKYRCIPLVLNTHDRSSLEYVIMNKEHTNGILPVVQCLIEQHGCDLLFKNHGIRIMALVYKHWNDDLIKYLILKKNFTTIIDDRTGETMLHKTCKTGQLDKTQFLIEECNCNPHVIDHNRNTLMHIITSSLNNISWCESADKCMIYIEILSYLYNNHHCSPNIPDNDGFTALDYAIKRKNLVLVRYFINQCDCDVFEEANTFIANNNEHIDTTKSDTALHVACRMKNFRLLKFLVEDCHCNQYVINKTNETIVDAFFSACSTQLTNHEFDILYYLIIDRKFYKKSSNINDDTCIRIFNIAAMKGIEGLHVYRYLVEECNCTLPKQQHINVMMQAYLNWNNELIKYLIVNMDCKPIIAKATGDTLLHAACRSKDLTRLKFLVEECNVKPNIINNAGETLMCTMIQYICSTDIEILHYICIGCECNWILSKDVRMNYIKFAITCGCEGMVPIVSYMIGNSGWETIAEKDHYNIIKLAYKNWQNDMIKYLVQIQQIGDALLQIVCNDNNIDKVKYLMEDCDCLQHISPATTLTLYMTNFNIMYYLFVECRCDQSMFSISDSDMLSCAIENSIVYTEKAIELVRNLVMKSKLSNIDQIHVISLAYTHWCNEIIRFLIVELCLDVIYDHQSGDTILHKACEDSNINKLKFLLEDCKCNPCVVNKNRETVLHTVCQSFSFSSEGLEIIRYLTTEYECYGIHSSMDSSNNTALHLLCDMISLFDDYNSKCIDAVYYLIKNCNINANIKNANGVTILHQLCGKIKSDSRVTRLILYLIEEGVCDPMIKDSFYDTPLHIILRATKQYSPNILALVYYFIHECKCDINTKNNVGNTPLHIACTYFTGDITVIEYILSTSKADPLARNDDDQTSLMILQESRRMLGFMDAARVERLISRFGEVKIVHPITSYVNVILLGNPGVGKSTLTKVIKDRNKYTFNQFRSVKEVKLHTAGIIPHILNDKELGRIILHDLAGQAEYYSSHTAVLENLLQGSAAVFVIVVSLADENFISSLHLWLTIIETASSNAFYQCQLLLVASHVDQPTCNKSIALDQIRQILLERTNDQNVLNAHGVYSLDCRKLGGNHLSNLISALSLACQEIAQTNNAKEMSLYCHMLYDFLQRSTQNAYTLESLVDEAKILPSLIVLPKNNVQVAKILSTLSSTGLIVFLRNLTHLKKSWIVTDKSILLSELDGILFAPNDFKEHVNIASNTGIIELSELGYLFPSYDCELLIQFLQYMELCQIITKEFITSSNIQCLSDASVAVNHHQYIFVPALIKDSQKPNIKEPFQFGWCIRCKNSRHFFLSRFLHLILLHLACKFADPQSADTTFKRLCKIWTTGIYWKNTKGVQVLVDLINNNQSLVLLVSCQDGAINEMIKLVKDVIIELLSCKQQVMPRVDVCEDVIDNSHLVYPLQSMDDLTLYNIELLAKCYINNDQFVLDRTGMIQTSITKLFPVTQVQYSEAIFADRDPKVL